MNIPTMKSIAKQLGKMGVSNAYDKVRYIFKGVNMELTGATIDKVIEITEQNHKNTIAFLKNRKRQVEATK